MPTQPYNIPIFNTGIEKDVESYLIPEDASPVIRNAYYWRKKIIRRRGNKLVGRIVEQDTNVIAGALAAGATTYSNTLSVAPIDASSVIIEIEDTGAAVVHTFTDDGFNALGTSASYVISNITKATQTLITATGHPYVGGESVYIYGVEGMTSINGGPYTVVATAVDQFRINVDSTTFNDYVAHGQVGTTIGTINYTTGAYTLQFPALPAPVGAYNVNETWEAYPLRPCMGILGAERASINDEDTVVFDTRVANVYNKTSNSFDDISFDTTSTHFNWSGSDHEFFWGWNYYRQDDGTGTFRNLFWVTNNVLADGIAYWNGQEGNGWTRLQAAAGPVIGTAIATRAAANYWVFTCKLIISYKDRLILLNTTEYVNGQQRTFSNRARWCQNGTPLTQGTGADTTAWYDDVPGKGGYIDAPTSEAIISCRFYKDTLVVFF